MSKRSARASQCARAAFVAASLLVLGPVVPQSGIPGDAHLKGMWSPVFDWPIIAIHAVLLPGGRLLTYGTDTDGRQTAYFTYDVWDPAQGVGPESHLTLPNVSGTDIFCSAQLLLPQSGAGVVLLGGDNWTGSGTTNTGNNDSNIFDSESNVLVRGNDMHRARWYATATTLANGETYIQGGKGGADRPEVRSTGGEFRLLSSADTSGLNWFYPQNFVAPDGRVFGIDSRGLMYYVDPTGPGAVTSVGQLPAENRGNDASAAMFRPGRILRYGGESNGAVVIDITSGAAVFSPTQRMSSQRRLSTATLLADGTVLATGGSQEWNKLVGVNTAAEIWDPSSGTWTVGAAAALARLYHSTAILLPDATVLVAGGGAPGPLKNLNAEIFYPPYLFGPNGTMAARPAVTSAPELVHIGESFALEIAGASGISRVTLVKTGSVTHGWNMDQRFLELPFTANGTSLLVGAPPSQNDAPPGTYLLFVIDGAGAPSVARIVRVESSNVPNQAPTVSAGPDRTIVLAKTASLAGSATDDGAPNPPGLLTFSWTKASGPGTVTFANSSALKTTARFSSVGLYSLKLAASDGELTADDVMSVRVNGNGTGLTGRYYNDPGTGSKFTTLALTRIDATVNFNWGTGSPASGTVQADNFSVRWTGQVQPLVTDSHVFSTVSTDGVRLWIDGALIIDNWTDHAATTNISAAVPLVAGQKYSVVMEYYDRTGGAQAKLRWAYPGQATQAIPKSQLYP